MRTIYSSSIFSWNIRHLKMRFPLFSLSEKIEYYIIFLVNTLVLTIKEPPQKWLAYCWSEIIKGNEFGLASIGPTLEPKLRSWNKNIAKYDVIYTIFNKSFLHKKVMQAMKNLKCLWWWKRYNPWCFYSHEGFSKFSFRKMIKCSW